MKFKIVTLGLTWLLASAPGASRAEPLELSEEAAHRCLAVLRAGLRGDEFWPSMHAAEALTLAGEGELVIAELGPRLDDETDDQRRCGLARELVRAGQWRHAEVMRKILEGDDPHGHVHAAESMYKVAEIGDGRAIRRAMKQSERRPLQVMAAAAAARCGSPSAMKLLRELLADSDTATARLAAWVLGRIGRESDAKAIRQRMGAVEDPVDRCFFEHSLALLGDDAGAEALLANLSSEDPAIRTYAATFAGEARLLSAAPRLLELLEDDGLDVRIRAAQSLLVMRQPPPADVHQDISLLVYPATDEHPRYTEGSIVRLADGSLLYGVTQFIGKGSDFSTAQIVARRSTDGGRHWGPPRVLQESTGKMNVMSLTLRRLEQPQSDAVAMFYLQKNDFDDLRVMLRVSSDETETFGPPRRVTAEPGYHVMNNDRVVRLSSGRLLVPVASTPDVRRVNHFVSRCWISDDAGATWRMGKGAVDAAKRGAMEPEVIELRDGRVLMIVRTQLGWIGASYSSDRGDTWTPIERLGDLVAPEAPATLRRIPATGDLLLIWNNTYQAGAGHGGKRTPLTAAVSSDEGRTWRHVRNLEDDPDRTYAYVSLEFVGPRAVMSYWEGAGGRLSSRFRSLPVAWFYEQP